MFTNEKVYAQTNFKVSFPGLPSHPQHELFKRIARAMSGMCCFYIKGNLENAKTFLASLKVNQY